MINGELASDESIGKVKDVLEKNNIGVLVAENGQEAKKMENINKKLFIS